MYGGFYRLERFNRPNQNIRKIVQSLARLYRAYISEMVAIVNSFKTCKEINIVGDCVSAMFAGDIEGARLLSKLFKLHPCPMQ